MNPTNDEQGLNNPLPQTMPVGGGGFAPKPPNPEMPRVLNETKNNVYDIRSRLQSKVAGSEVTKIPIEVKRIEDTLRGEVERLKTENLEYQSKIQALEKSLATTKQANRQLYEEMVQMKEKISSGIALEQMEQNTPAQVRKPLRPGYSASPYQVSPIAYTPPEVVPPIVETKAKETTPNLESKEENNSILEKEVSDSISESPNVIEQRNNTPEIVIEKKESNLNYEMASKLSENLFSKIPKDKASTEQILNGLIFSVQSRKQEAKDSEVAKMDMMNIYETDRKDVLALLNAVDSEAYALNFFPNLIMPDGSRKELNIDEKHMVYEVAKKMLAYDIFYGHDLKIGKVDLFGARNVDIRKEVSALINKLNILSERYVPATKEVIEVTDKSVVLPDGKLSIYKEGGANDAIVFRPNETVEQYIDGVRDRFKKLLESLQHKY